MTTIRTPLAITLISTFSMVPNLHSQVQTIVPAVIPGAKPVKTENIKIHGAALEGNLKGENVDRDDIIYLPPS